MKNIKIKNDIDVHIIDTEKFKTNIVSIFLSNKLTREDVTKDALIPAILRLGTANIKTQMEINKKLEDMYGADFNCGVEKRGDNHVLKFYIETIDDSFTLDKEELLKDSINFLLNIILNPLVVNNGFNPEYLKSEKENITRIIKSKIDNKSTYSYIRCVEEMYKGKEYGLNEYGYIEDLDKIDEQNLYKYYIDLLNKCKIDIFISGRINDKNIINEIKNNENLNKLRNRTANFVKDSKERILKNIKEKEVVESMDVSQGKIAIGLSILNSNNETAILNVYNAILGGGANSKLFQNVREKSSLAYTAGSIYLRPKNNIFIKCGIEIKNYNKTIDIIKKQLIDMQNGDFTDKDIKDAKQLITAGLKNILDEQSSQISYEFSQELSNEKITIEEFIKNIQNVNKQEIIDVAKRTQINTIYFLKNK